MTTYDWATIRADAIARFGGDAPRAELEQRIIDVFEKQPQLVVLAIDKIADSYHAGRVRSPWAVLGTHIERAAEPGADIQATDTTDKQKRIQRAEQWIRAAGIHFDREAEILLELFGSESAQLRPYAQVDLIPDTSADPAKWKLSEPRGDTALIDRMLHTWGEHRPTGLQLEREAEERADAYKQQQAARAEALAQAHAAVQAEAAKKQAALATIGAANDTGDADDDLPI